jgi:hypothetical protein
MILTTEVFLFKYCTKFSIAYPTTYQTRHFFNNPKTNEDISTKQTHSTDILLFISHTTNVLLFKSRCNIFIRFRIIKEMPGLLGSGTPCITLPLFQYTNINTHSVCFSLSLSRFFACVEIFQSLSFLQFLVRSWSINNYKEILFS